MAPTHLSKVESHDKMLRYFLTRAMYWWVMEENREANCDEEGDKPGRKISRSILKGKEPTELKGANWQ